MAMPVTIAIAALAALGIVLVREMRKRTLAALRAEWAIPADKARRMDAMAASHASRLSYLASTASLDARTWIDLDLDAVFAVLDRTTSTLGQHALYHRLRTAPIAPHLEAFDRLVARMTANVPARERAQLALRHLRDPHGYDLWWLGTAEAARPRGWYVLFPVLTSLTLLTIGLAFVTPSVLPLLVPMVIANVIARASTDRQIGAMAAAFRQIAPVVSAGEQLRFLATDADDPLLGPLCRDLAPLRRLKTIARWISGDPLMLPPDTGPLGAMVNDVVSAVYEYVNLALLLDANGVFFGGRALRAHHHELLRVVAAIGEADAAISVGSFRAGQSVWSRPVHRPPGAVALVEAVRHPLLQEAVANSIELPPGRGVLITGSNMSGKSTFLRTLGVTAVLAQTVYTCLAAAYEGPVFVVRSAIGRGDDLLSGRSYYVAEVESLLGLIEASHGPVPCLFLLDELFRGTNAVERIAAGQAVLRHLVGTRGETPHVAVTATHDLELVELLAGSYVPFHFGDTVTDDGLTFDHRLRPGPSSTRNAIALLRLHGAPPALVKDALSCADTLDAERDPAHRG